MYLLIDNYDSFTYNIYQYLSELTEQEIRVFRNDRITLAEIREMDPEKIIISPGPGRPEDAGISVELIKEFADSIPILGVCLGHQAVAYAFGAEIVQAKRIVHGKTDNITNDGRGLFRTIPSPSIFTRYHSLVVEPGSVPDELEVTSWSSDGEIMGVRHKEHLVEGVQFHPESVASDLGRELLRNFLIYRREPLAHKKLLTKALRKENLSQEEAAGFMRELTEGSLSHSQIAAYLIALNAKGIVPEEIAGCASVLLEKRIPLKVSKPVLDTCGTGGDGLGTFNISSFAALIASACGATVAKHGNRAVSSLSGSADFYKELGFVTDLSPKASEKLIEKTGFAFLFAPIYHSAMKYAAPVRRDLGIKTIMNLLGPLVNPAAAQFQLIGTYDEDLCLPVAQAAHMLGIKRVMVVHGKDGLDEISVTGPTRIVSIDEEGKISDEIFEPESLGLDLFDLEELKGGSATENVGIARGLLSGETTGALREAVLLNAGAALQVCGLADSLKEGYEKAKKALDDGLVGQKIDEIKTESQRLKGALR
jgi:anthranilate synthase/phosphoribosyltransferase